MPITAVISVSFQSDPPANNAMDIALTGSISASKATGPFTRQGTTATYRCNAGSDAAVLPALQKLFTELNAHAGSLDSVNITVLRHP